MVLTLEYVYHIHFNICATFIYISVCNIYVHFYIYIQHSRTPEHDSGCMHGGGGAGGGGHELPTMTRGAPAVTYIQVI